ncbi:hypothetical protein BDN70DRAFT_924289 [Pholiota conissans]|uniref:F-box domain-containing protein n=1 Tax=Pholiota conissans TaxID=109636 RepID=A0A9P6CQE9_9AGAR|nr:hypothetical protein BDN70DRAFT_924289 [Pholiota conissans]
MESSFLGLNLDIHLQVMSNLDAVSLIRYATTCRSLYETFQNSSELSYTIQLFLEGLEAKYGNTKSSPAELLANLRLRRELQTSFKWSGYESILINGSISEEKMANNRKRILELVPWDTGSNVLQRFMGKAALNITSKYFVIDSSQDIFAWFEDTFIAPVGQNVQNAVNQQRIWIHTLSTGLPHPLARKENLEFFESSDFAIANSFHVAMQIVQETLSFSIHLPEKNARVILWNWKSSDLLYDSGSERFNATDTPYYRSADFILLSPTSYLVTSIADSGSINLFSVVLPFPRSEHEAPVMASGAQYGKSIHVAALHFPSLIPGCSCIISLTADAGPLSSGPMLRHPYRQREDDRLYMFRIQYLPFEIHQESRDILVFVHNHVFTAYMNRDSVDSTNLLPVRVPWGEWGPWNTRVIAANQELMLDCGSGQRVLLRRHDRALQPDATVCTVVEVLDFSRATLLAHGPGSTAYNPVNDSDVDRTVPLERDPDDTNIWHYSASTKLSPTRFPMFSDDVETHLPFVSVILPLKFQYFRYILHDDGIAGLCAFLGGAVFDAYTHNQKLCNNMQL